MSVCLSVSATGLSLMLSSQASYVIVSGFRAALDLDTYPLSNFIRPRFTEWAKRGRGKPVLIMHIGFFACFHAISLERSRFSEIATLYFLSLVALKLLVSLMSRLVACSARKVADKQTNRQIHSDRTTTVSIHTIIIGLAHYSGKDDWTALLGPSHQLAVRMRIMRTRAHTRIVLCVHVYMYRMRYMRIAMRYRPAPRVSTLVPFNTYCSTLLHAIGYYY